MKKLFGTNSEAFELHELYGKHEWRPISDKNVIHYCEGCGSWVGKFNRSNMQRDEVLTPLSSSDFGKTQGFNLEKVGYLISAERKASLIRYLELSDKMEQDVKNNGATK